MSEHFVYITTNCSHKEVMAQIYTSIPMPFWGYDQFKNCTLGEFQSLVQSFETVFFEHKNDIDHANNSFVVSEGRTDEDKYHPFFKSRSSSMISGSIIRKERKEVHMIEVAFIFLFVLQLHIWWTFNELLETIDETFLVSCAGLELYQKVIKTAWLEEQWNCFRQLWNKLRL